MAWPRLLRLRIALVLPLAGLATFAGAAGAGGEGRPVLIQVAAGLHEPVFVAPAPSGLSGRLYVVERGGVIRIVDQGHVLPKPFLDIRRRVRGGGLRGLFSVAFDPSFRRNGWFYVNYVGRDGDVYVTAFRSVHGVGAVSSLRVLLRVPTVRKDAYGHYGGQLAFGPDGRLYAGFGDADQPETAQDPTTLLGKLVRLDVRHPSPEPKIVAVGLRNPWRMSFDRATGDLYIGDVGENLREEIDRLPRGFRGIANFGWDLWEGSLRTREPLVKQSGRLEPPFLEYRHARGRCNSVTGGYVYRGRVLGRLRGRYLYGDLCGGIWSVAVQGGVARGRRAEPLSPPGLLVSFGEGTNGELYAISLSGGIYEVGTES